MKKCKVTMRVRLILSVIVLVVTLCISNCEEVESPVLEQRANNTDNNLPLTDEKFFWEWLYGLISNISTTTQAPKPAPPIPSCAPCSCGLTNKQNRIVGGVATQVNQYPWMALMMYRGRFYCGGSIINSRYVLTAAHCVDRFDSNLMSVRILEHNRNSLSDTEAQEFKVDSVIRHTGYSNFNYNNDIALVKLKDTVKFDGKMRPVCLPDRMKTFAGIDGIVTGWGAISEGGPLSPTLQEVYVPILTNSECRATKYPARRITDNMLCAGYKEGSKDSCQGDSGGPLHVVNDNVHQIVGVVSWGEGCAQPGYPGVYARVNRYITWIKRNTEDACYC